MLKLLGLILLIFVHISCSKQEESELVSGVQPISVSFLSDPSGKVLSGANNNNIVLEFSTIGSTEVNTASIISVDLGSGWEEVSSCTDLNISASCSWSIPNINVSFAKFKIEVNISGVKYSAQSDSFMIDSTAPTISSFSIANGDPTTTNQNIFLDLIATDDFGMIDSYCIQYGNTIIPQESASCWHPISKVQNLNLDDSQTTLPLIPGEHKAYVFVKDAANNISTLSNSGIGTINLDHAQIIFQIGNPPILNNIIVSKNPNPQDPPSTSDKTFISTSPVYIKWSASDTESLGSQPISLYFTTDDISYSEIAKNLINGSNDSCVVNDTTTADDTATGCYIWNTNSTPASYFKIRIKAVDETGQVTYSSSSSLNISFINFIAGNTDPGLGGSASSAVFFPTDYSNATPDVGHMLVANNGDFYFKDKRGLLRVSAIDGLQNIFLQIDNSIDLTDISQSGNISPTTRLKDPQYMTLDFDGNILVFDYDRIRKINLSTTPNTIETIIGGGNSNGEGVTAKDYQITPLTTYHFSYMPFTPLPNGDLLFQSENYFGTPNTGYKIRYYTHATKLITSFSVGGFGHHMDDAADLSGCNFKKVNITFDPSDSSITTANTIVYCSGTYYGVSLNPNTFQSIGNSGVHPTSTANWNGVKAGLDGNAYLVNKVSGQLLKFNTTTTAWDIIAGTYGIGRCDNDNIATSCKVHPYDIFVDKLSKVYFLDRGKIRTIDSNNKLQTIMGQSGDFGDGLKATNARFGKTYIFKHWNDAGTDKLVILDHHENRLREITYDGNIQTIAGDGSADIPTTIEPSSTAPIFINSAGTYWLGFAIDQTNGNVFMNRGNRHIAYLNRATDRWIDVIGGGGNYYYNGDGLNGNQITNEYGYPPIVMAQGDNKLVVAWTNYQAGVGLKDMHYKIYDQSSSYNQSHLAGDSNHSYSMCSDGTNLNACPMQRPVDGSSSMEFDNLNSQWLYQDTYTSSLKNLKIGSPTASFNNFTGTTLNFTYHSASNTFYFCNFADGKIYKKVGSGVETSLDWPITSLSCEGRTMHYHAGRDSLFFIYKQNELFGVAEYLNP